MRYVVAGEDGEAEENALWNPWIDRIQQLYSLYLAILIQFHSPRPSKAIQGVTWCHMVSLHRMVPRLPSVLRRRNSSPSPQLDLRLSWAIQLFASIQRWEVDGTGWKWWESCHHNVENSRLPTFPNHTFFNFFNWETLTLYTDFVHSTLGDLGRLFFFVHSLKKSWKQSDCRVAIASMC